MKPERADPQRGSVSRRALQASKPPFAHRLLPLLKALPPAIHFRENIRQRHRRDNILPPKDALEESAGAINGIVANRGSACVVVACRNLVPTGSETSSFVLLSSAPGFYCKPRNTAPSKSALMQFSASQRSNHMRPIAFSAPIASTPSLVLLWGDESSRHLQPSAFRQRLRILGKCGPTSAFPYSLPASTVLDRNAFHPSNFFACSRTALLFAPFHFDRCPEKCGSVSQARAPGTHRKAHAQAVPVRISPGPYRGMRNPPQSAASPLPPVQIVPIPVRGNLVRHSSSGHFPCVCASIRDITPLKESTGADWSGDILVRRELELGPICTAGKKCRPLIVVRIALAVR